jgi:hypothetical protein
MNHENIPTITIPLPGLSNDSLGQIIEILNREGSTLSLYADHDEIATHYDRQLHIALVERFGRNLAADKIRREQARLPLLGATVSHSNPMQIPA